MKGHPHGNYGNADRATARSLALSVKPSARGVDSIDIEVLRGHSVPVNHGNQVWLV